MVFTFLCSLSPYFCLYSLFFNISASLYRKIFIIGIGFMMPGMGRIRFVVEDIAVIVTYKIINHDSHTLLRIFFRIDFLWEIDSLFFNSKNVFLTLPLFHFTYIAMETKEIQDFASQLAFLLIHKLCRIDYLVFFSFLIFHQSSFQKQRKVNVILFR